jgi:hypothetical protein
MFINICSILKLGDWEIEISSRLRDPHFPTHYSVRNDFTDHHAVSMHDSHTVHSAMRDVTIA